MAKITPYVFLQEFDDNGDPLAGGKLFTYEAGTTTPKVTYTDSNEGTANANPVVLDSAGRADVWLGSGAYKFVLKTSADVTVKEVDNITGDSANVFGSSVVDLTGNTTVTSAYQNNVLDCDGTFTLSLLSAATAEEGFVFGVKNSGSGIITIDPDGSETINSSATYAVAAGASVFVICDGTNWITFGDFDAAIKVTSNDTTFGYLNDKIVAGTFTTKTENNDGANETLTIDADRELIVNIDQNSKSADYTLVLTDANDHILHPSADTTPRTFTIPANSSVAFPIGTAVTFVNQDSAGALTIAITTDTMRLAGTGTTGSRTLAANGVATALKITSTEWIISGVGLT